jgi:hypothetical protein
LGAGAPPRRTEAPQLCPCAAAAARRKIASHLMSGRRHTCTPHPRRRL